ncbi:MAG TPA: hypothetical protein VEK13_02605 [Thermoplasmata archaeon]|nr:hypothetical protein [Thermoplasmata archaeon]
MSTAVPASAPLAGLAPISVVWCRQVDNEAESPGYTTIPEEFPGRRETLEAIRMIGNLTVNVADTHDYWDPDPSQPLSYYPNLFLYPAANGRYTCIGRMFLSTEDRPRLGMKTLVFSTADLVESGEFGPAVLRAHASMGGKSGPPRVTAEPDASVYQAIGEGFLFHRGTTEPVVVVAAEQWESASQVVLDMVRLLPTSLIALSAFLVFPYFLPEAKVNPHEFTEQIPLALAVMRVPKGEAQGERHSKRLDSWGSAPVMLRDLTKPTPTRSRESLPLVLQYVRDHQDPKISEVSRRVDAVEGTRMQAEIQDAEGQGGRDRRKEMWRIGTAMETAALLLVKPKGRSVPMSGEAVKRANEYLQAQPSIPIPRAIEAPLPPEPISGPAPSPGTTQHPPWLQRPVDIALPASSTPGVPLSVSDDNSLRTGSPPPEGSASVAAAVAPVPVGDADLDARIRRILDQRLAELPKPVADPTEAAQRDARLLATVDTKIREATEQSARGMLGVQADVGARIAAVESRPVLDPGTVSAQVEKNLHAQLDPTLAEVTEKSRQAVQSATEAWSARLREELRQSIDEAKAGFAHGEDELRTALAAQLEVELAETKEQGTALREEIEARVRDLLKAHAAEIEQRRTKDVRDLEQRLGILVDGRTKDVETRLKAAVTDLQSRSSAALDERVNGVEKRLGVEREARVAELSVAQTEALAGLQVRLQAFVEQKLNENQEKERDKYVELLARLRTEVEQTLAKTVDPSRFDAAIKERIAPAVASARADQQLALTKEIAEAENRLRAAQDDGLLRVETVESRLAQREADLQRVENGLRSDLEDLDRRIQVLSDRMIPLLRKTWLKVGDLEKGAPISEETEVRFKEIRREMVREMRRIEGDLVEQTNELRDRLEGTIAHQGRIWLNLLKQLSQETEELSGDLLTGPRPAQRPSRLNSYRSQDDFLASDLGTPVAYAPLGEDPPNPIAPPDGSADEASRDARRRPRRS